MLPSSLQLNPQQLNDLLENYDLRKEFVKKFGMLGFGILYLPHYFYLPPADFHNDLIKNIEDPDIDLLEVIGWRGCAKSVMGSLVLPIYADRKSTRLNSSHIQKSRMPSSA